jgi:poly(3-hydroxybutyrate) depolymerase
VIAREETIVMQRAMFTLALVLVPTLAHAAWETKQLATMSVEVYTPASASPIGDGHGLLVALHGCSQTGSQLRQYGNFEAAAEDFGLVIALPTVPGGGVVAGCWNYYGAVHTRTSGHNKPILDMTAALRDDAAYDIDPAQIYLAGFSSGGGQALVVGCLAPELYAGVAISAGPSLGTSISQIAQVATTGAQAAALCQQFAGSNAADFATQLAITFTDTQDFTVAQGYAQVNADMYASVFGGGLSDSAIDVAMLPGSGPTGTGTAYADGEGERIASITSMGVGHNWPSGSGAAGPPLSYVAGAGLNLSYFAAETFTANSRRAEGEWMPGEDTGNADGSGGDDGDATGSDDAADDDDAGDDAAGSDGDDGDDDGHDDGDDDGPPSSDGVGTSGITAGQQIEPSGCQCRSDRGDRSGALPWLACVLIAIVRRRVSPRS